MSHVKKIVVAGLSAGIALTAAAGCTGPAARPGAAGPAATPPSSAPTAPATPSAPSKPTSSKPAKPSTTSGGSGGGASDKVTWAKVDFRKQMFYDLNCPDVPEAKGRAQVYSTKRVDLTGDGRKEVVVAGTCVYLSGADGAHVLIYPGNDRDIENLIPLVDIGQDQDLTSAAVRIDGRRVTVTSKALSKKAPTCCPDLQITQTYKWDGGTFVRTNISQVKLPTE
ncbi:hypothetical protein AB0M54_09245 [Actinoplanes sp. NPDC051470]|uniref:hypothetical protein n=1 Tax=Actinoplanes sp. NPDC051470 TaxID=3157224 RepID=UPI003418829C